MQVLSPFNVLSPSPSTPPSQLADGPQLLTHSQIPIALRNQGQRATLDKSVLFQVGVRTEHSKQQLKQKSMWRLTPLPGRMDGVRQRGAKQSLTAHKLWHTDRRLDKALAKKIRSRSLCAA